MIIAVLRHAEASATTTVYPTDTELALTSTGRRAAAHLRPVIRAFAPQEVWRSPSHRVTQTWDIAGDGIESPVHQHPALAERHFTSLQGLDLAQISAVLGPAERERGRRHPELLDPPGEMSLAEAANRLVTATTEIVEAAHSRSVDRLLIVTHGGPSRWLLCALTATPATQNGLFQHDVGRFHVLDVEPGLTLRRIAALNSADIATPRRMGHHGLNAELATSGASQR